MILGQHDLEGAEERLYPAGGSPAELGGMAPPNVELPEEEAQGRSLPGEAGGSQRHDRVGERSQDAVEEDRRIAREDGVIPIGTTTVVMGAKVQREPEMLRHVVKEGRAEIPDNEDDK